MSGPLRREIWRRARNACEYCLVPQAAYSTSFEVDHVIARQHDGQTVLANLALSCLHYNSHKGPNIAGTDPLTGKLTKLFHPRRHQWKRHFRWQGPLLIGRTAIGRTTIAVLAMNHPDAVQVRGALVEEGLFEEGLFPPG